MRLKAKYIPLCQTARSSAECRVPKIGRKHAMPVENTIQKTRATSRHNSQECVLHRHSQHRTERKVMERLAVEPEGVAGYPNVPEMWPISPDDTAMGHIPIQTRIQRAHDENINQRRQADQTDAYGGWPKRMQHRSTTPKQCSVQGANDRQKARYARGKYNTDDTRHRPLQ